MAVQRKTYYANQANWSAANAWESVEGGEDDTGPPGIGDTVVLASGAGPCTLDENSAALGILVMNGYNNTLAMGVNSISVNGDASLDGTITASAGANMYFSQNFTKVIGMTALPAALNIELDGTGNVACNGVAGGALIINTAGTHTAVDAGLWDSFTLTAGTYVDGGFAHTITGAVDMGAGVLTGTSIWAMTGTTTFKSSFANAIPKDLRVDGTVTTVNPAYTRRLSGTGEVISGGGTIALSIPNPTVAWWGFTGTMTALLTVFITNDVGPGSDLTLANKLLIRAESGGSRTLTMDGNTYVPPGHKTTFDATSAGTKMSVVFGEYSINTPDLWLGAAAGGADKSAGVDFGTAAHKITNLKNQHADNVNCTVDFGSSYIEIGTGGTLDGSEGGTADITPTCTTGACHIVGGEIARWTDPGGLVHTHDTTVTACHANYTDSTHAHPGTLMGMGVGI